MSHYNVQLHIHSATKLAPSDLNGLADPYVKFKYKGIKLKTQVQEKTINPIWDEYFLLDYHEGVDEPNLTLEIWDHDNWSTNDPMGQVKMNLSNLLVNGSAGLYPFPVAKLHGEGGGGLLNIRLLIHVRQCNLILEKSRIHDISSRLGGQENFYVTCKAFVNFILSAGNSNIVQSSSHGALSPLQNAPYVQAPLGRIPSRPSYQPSYQPSHFPPGYVDMNSQLVHSVDGSSSRLTPTSRCAYVPSDSVLISEQSPSKLHELQEMFPNHNELEITRALVRCNGDKNAAVHLLLEQQRDRAYEGSQGLFLQSQRPTSEYGESQLYKARTNDYGDENAVPMSIQTGFSGRKKSLLIGINYFDTRSELRGCISDVTKMRKALTSLYGFPEFPNAMVCLRDDSDDWRFKPTRQNIIYAMNWLVQDARPGDAYFFHFSGHGSQSRNSDDTEEDGWDETILPVDYEDAGMIKDDEIHAILVEPLPSGVRLTAVMDCCHSGTGLDLPYMWEANEQKWDEEYAPFFTQGDVQLFSGCTDSQVSADVQKSDGVCTAGGAMTSAFLAALAKNPYNHSYPSLLDTIRTELERGGYGQQVPQLTATQKFDVNRTFSLTDSIPNSNRELGRQGIRNRRRRRPNQDLWENFSASDLFNNVGPLVQVGLGLFNEFKQFL